jgi:hydrogenase-4 component B
LTWHVVKFNLDYDNTMLSLGFFILPGLGSSIFALMFQRWPLLQKKLVFIGIGLSGFFAFYTGLSTLLTSQYFQYSTKSESPYLHVQFNLDPLSAFFLILIGIIIIGVSFYGPGYVNSSSEKQNGSTLWASLIYFFTGLFITSMYLVVLAADTISFIFAWELMSVSSYFLVIHNHQEHANRNAALVYLLMSQTSALLILFSFGLLAKTSGSMSFAGWHDLSLKPEMAHFAFLLAFLGFGMKAGVVPLHIWLPKAHPIAPSHISALMSGVMLKVAVYGFIRFTFCLLPHVHWQWGVITLFVGIVSALVGILYALMQHNLKKLLAYSSIENIGIIFSALGLSLIFTYFKHPLLAALALIAALHHCLNHAIFKSLLFMGAGVISKFSHENNLEHLGGLIKRMPYTAWFFLIGCISISALPPFNGFVSEWLFFQTAIQAATLKSDVLRTLIPLAAAVIALTSALAAACFVKVYGVAFLGQARSADIEKACDPSGAMKMAMGFLALLCFLLGVFPFFTIRLLAIVTKHLIDAQPAISNNWLWLIPLDPKTSSYSPALIGGGIIIVSVLAYFLIRIYYGHINIKITKPWDCGFGGINKKMQYSSVAFAMPIRRLFHNIYRPEEKIERNVQGINYFLQTKDLVLQYIYLPIERFASGFSRLCQKMQGGNVRIYLTYIFITLILLLWATAQFG